MLAFFDTGNSFVKLPLPEYEAFMKVVNFRHTTYTKPEFPGFTFSECETVDPEGWPTIKMRLGDEDDNKYWFYLMP